MSSQVDLSWETLEVGRTFPPATFEVTDEAIRRYVEATGDEHPTFRDADASGRPRPAPNTFGHLFAVPRIILPDARVPPGGVHARQEYQFGEPIRAGDRLTSTMRVAEKYERRGRRYLVYEFEIRNERGELCMTSRMTAIPGR